jgi:hypothetical protein
LIILISPRLINKLGAKNKNDLLFYNGSIAFSKELLKVCPSNIVPSFK